MKIISNDDIKSLNISPCECYKWTEEMIANKKKEGTILPAKTHMAMPGNIFCNVMPCIVDYPEGAIGGVKVVTRYPERKPLLDSKILLFNAESGNFLALMDGNWITAMRTGAVAAHSVLHLAKSGWKTIGMIGLGNTARSSLLVLATLVKDKHITVKILRYKDQAELFVKRFEGFDNLRFVIAETVEECVRGSDVIISCATYFERDIALDEWFDEGVLVVPVHTRGFTNCDLFFDKVFADDTGHVDHFKNFSRFRYFAEMSDVINGNSIGRENNSERILAYNIGVSIHDINYAAHIYCLMKQNKELYGHLMTVDMCEPTNKFWI